MNVSRQAVSKWEGAQAIPDLEKILRLGELFGVTTDYLLKDDIEDEEFTDPNLDSSVKRITLADANEFMEWRKSASIWIATATFLCILSVIPLFILGAASEIPSVGISENFAGGVGLIALFSIVAIAVGIYIYTGIKNAPYEFLDKEPFDAEYGVRGMVREKQKAYRNTYVKGNIIGGCFCVLSPIALCAGVFTENEFLITVMLSVTMLIAGIGVVFFIIAGVRWASMQKLLKEGEFSVQGKKVSRVKESMGTIYWLVVTAVYLGWSFVTNSWHSTWIVWPVAGVLFAAVMILCNLFVDKNH
ncbi:MAG: helix-turn-helix domain-containing protein [Clostridia bacterium]